MVKRIIAICFIYICTTLSWVILAGTMFIRTDTQDMKLQESVGQLWGAAQTQPAPKVFSKIEQGTKYNEYYPLAASDINVDIDIDYRKIRSAMVFHLSSQIFRRISYRKCYPATKRSGF